MGRNDRSVVFGTGRSSNSSRLNARPLILKTIQEARINLNRYLPLVWQQLGHADRSQDEHRRIVELCRKGDAVRAGQLVERHILSTGRLIVGFLKNRELGGPGAGIHEKPSYPATP